MSCVVVMVPLVRIRGTRSWRVMSDAVAAAAANAGFRVSKEPGRITIRNTVELEMEHGDAVTETLGHEDEISVERKGVRVTFSRSARGEFKICVDGEPPKDELRRTGEDLAGRVIQQYVYRRLLGELEHNGFQTVSEEQGVDDSIHLHVRRYGS
ncbi:DUF1257 domain-containing protein [Planctomycetota bacterium]